jgi:hypothetical protein
MLRCNNGLSGQILGSDKLLAVVTKLNQAASSDLFKPFGEATVKNGSR